MAELAKTLVEHRTSICQNYLALIEREDVYAECLHAKGHEAAGLEASARHCQHVNEVHKAAGSEASARHYSWPVGKESRFRLRSYFFS